MERKPTVRRGRTARAQHGLHWTCVSPPFQVPARAAKGSEWLGSGWEGLNVSPPGSRESELKPLSSIPEDCVLEEPIQCQSSSLETFVSTLSGSHLAGIALALFANKMMEVRYGPEQRGQG